MLTEGQMRAARGLIDWTQPDLAERSGVALATVKRMEKLGPARSSAGNVDAVQRALEAAGVIFLNEGATTEGGPGVRLRSQQS